MQQVQSIKCVVVGDGAVGKTSVLISFSSNTFPEEHAPTVFDNYMCQVMWKKQPISLQLWDTAGQEDYDRLRPLSYPETDVFVVCFDISSSTSLSNVSSKWIPEIKKYCPNVPIILCGNKSDLRDDLEFVRKLESSKKDSMVLKDAAQQVAKENGCEDYCEVSARTQHGLKQLFDRVIQSVLEPKPIVNSSNNGRSDTKKNKCLLM